MAAATAAKIQELGDLELAALLCLTADEHCIITSESKLVNDVAQELLLVGTYHRFPYEPRLTGTTRYANGYSASAAL